MNGPRIPDALKAQLKAQLDARIDRDIARIRELRGDAVLLLTTFVSEAPKDAPEMPEALLRLGELAGRSSAKRSSCGSRSGTRSPSISAAPLLSRTSALARPLRPRAQGLPAVPRVRSRPLRRRLPRERARPGRRGARALRPHPPGLPAVALHARRAHVQGRGALQPEVRLRERAEGIRRGPQVQGERPATASRSSRARGASGASGTRTKRPSGSSACSR